MNVIWSVLEGLGFEPTTFFLQIFLFFVLHFSLNFLIYQPIVEMKDKRDARLAKNLREAEKSAAEARRLKEQYEQQVRTARVESQTALLLATESAEAEGKARVAKAREEAGKIMAQARTEAQAARDKAFADAQAESQKIADAIIERLFTASLGESKGRDVAVKLGGAKS